MGCSFTIGLLLIFRRNALMVSGRLSWTQFSTGVIGKYRELSRSVVAFGFDETKRPSRGTIVGMNPDARRQAMAREAKAIVALAFRNGPIEHVHAGRTCPTSTGHEGYSRITDDEMKAIMKNAVDRVCGFNSAQGTHCDGMNRRC